MVNVMFYSNIQKAGGATAIYINIKCFILYNNGLNCLYDEQKIFSFEMVPPQKMIYMIPLVIHIQKYNQLVCH